MKFPLAFPLESGLSQQGGGVYRVTGGCGFRHVSPACLGPPLWLTMSCKRVGRWLLLFGAARATFSPGALTFTREESLPLPCLV
jgi:hypothetical protein